MHTISGSALCFTLVTALGASLTACTEVSTSTGDDVEDVGDDAPDAGTEPEVDAEPEPDADVACTLDCGAHGACVADGGGAWSCGCDAGYDGAACDACAPGYRAEADDAALCTLALPATTNLALWLDTTVLTSFTVSGTAVATWRDRRGAGVTLTAPSAGARPTYVGAALNGRAVVRFGGDDDLVASGFAGLRGADYTIFVVMTPGPLGGDSIVRTVNVEQGTTLRFERMAPGTSYQLRHDAPFSGAGDVVSAGFGNTSSTKLVVLRRWTSGLLDHMRLLGNDGDALDGVDTIQSTLVEGAIDVTHTLHLGDADLQGDVAELLVYDRAIGDAELAEIQAYLAAKWGVQ